MKIAEKKLRYKIYESIEELPENLQLLLKNARKETQNAFAPYSNFKVGAALQLENQMIIGGNNQENAAFPSGLCAERTAIFYAQSQYPNVPIDAIAITAFFKDKITDETIKPCGACCQVLSEAEKRGGKNMTIVLDGQKQIEVIEGVNMLLPFRFSGEELKHL
ncbi:cytidine deaminase [Halosquirtibacter xylanolyticus]|uniref:cytidine deaminase n=1 Tax=Halosquirtibacter xylanolyticus TaxID=3374599 RepID=UPI00374A4E5A|nr:cytidine deaminase [Prolixibacteraceae bacterium]